jgi:CubicO group peptidase (beta-lactamase class C family)
MRLARFFLTLVLVFAAAHPGVAVAQARPAANTAQIIDGLRKRIKHLVDTTKVASLSVAVAKDGRIIWEEGFGYADIEHKLPPTPETMYSLASISKPFTATGFMKLVEQGKINLDHPVNDYLGAGKLTGLAADASQATVRRLLSHTAGLPLHYHFYYEDRGGDPKLTMDQAISRYGIIVYPPGAVWEYSNLGYGIVDHIIARVSGTSYEDFLRTQVFEPLGLRHTTISTGVGLKNAAVRYDTAHVAVIPYDFDHRGGSAVYASAHDLVRFGMFHLKDHLKDQKPILADSTITLMHQPASGNTVLGGSFTATTAYGLGWLVGTEHGIQKVWHTGGMPGVSTTLSLFPTADLAIVVLANQRSAAPFLAAEDIAAAFLPPEYGKDLAASRAAPRPKPAPFNAPANLVGEWSGTIKTYQGTVPLHLTIKGSEIRVRMGDSHAQTMLLDHPQLAHGVLSGEFAGTIPTDDARRHPHQVTLSLHVEGNKLKGFAAAVDTDTRATFALSSYAELTKR